MIVPCYNEGKRLPYFDFHQYLKDHETHCDLLFVNDGSSDNTIELISRICKEFPERASYLDLKKNLGKAGAVRAGVLHVISNGQKHDYIGFMDADLSTPLSEIKEMEITIDQLDSPTMVIGSRIKLFGSTSINRSTKRHFIGRIIATFISNGLKLGIYDTQCGFKFIRRDKLNELFEEDFISRWLFDVELIFRLIGIYGYQGIQGQLYEVPVKTWTEKGDSKIPLSYALKIPFELRKIRKYYKKKLTTSKIKASI